MAAPFISFKFFCINTYYNAE